MNLEHDSLLSPLRETLKRGQEAIGDSFYAWKISLINERSIQSLLLGKEGGPFELYQQRDVIDHCYTVTVYSRHSDPMMMGSSSCTIDPLVDLERQVKALYDNSLLVSNKPWDLPREVNGEYEEVLTSDPIIAGDINKAHLMLMAEVNDKVKILDRVKVNSGELFTNLSCEYFETSFGLKGQQKDSNLYFEIAIEKVPGPNTQEVLRYISALSIEDANLSQFIDETVTECLSISDTELPKTADSVNVVVDQEVIASLLSNLVSQLKADREYEKVPFMKSGDSVLATDQKSGSDTLSLELDPSRPVMVLSTPFTHEGMRPKKAEVIKDNIVQTQIINHRIGQYLAKDANYIAGNMVVKAGKAEKESLVGECEECIEVISFSSLLVSPSTLTWSSEIKLGKLYRKGKFVSMLKGGVMSGSIKENLTDIRLSNETTTYNYVGGGFYPSMGYAGPKYMLIKSGVKVVGE